MRRVVRILGVLLIFIFGMIVGGAGASAGAAQKIREKIREVLTGGPEAVVKEIVKRLDEELKLDPEQKRMLQGIADETHIKLRQSRAKIQPEMDLTLAEAEARVRAILYPEQVGKFDKLVHRGADKWKAKEGGADAPVAPEPAAPEAEKAP
jgi:hypothetical protein